MYPENIKSLSTEKQKNSKLHDWLEHAYHTKIWQKLQPITRNLWWWETSVRSIWDWTHNLLYGIRFTGSTGSSARWFFVCRLHYKTVSERKIQGCNYTVLVKFTCCLLACCRVWDRIYDLPLLEFLDPNYGASLAGVDPFYTMLCQRPSLGRIVSWLQMILRVCAAPANVRL